MLVRPPCTNSLPNKKYSVPASAVIPSIRGPKARKKDSPSLSSSFPRGMRPCAQQLLIDASGDQSRLWTPEPCSMNGVRHVCRDSVKITMTA